MVYIRSATEHDNATIKQMVSNEHLDPMSIKWQQFLVAEVDEKIVGIGQIRKHADCEELGSLVVLKDYRGQGIAAQLIAALEARAGRPLYLKCRDKMIPYYQQFGFQLIRYQEAPRSFRIKLLIPMFLRVFGLRVGVMRKD